jgi:hypothetical protein
VLRIGRIDVARGHDHDSHPSSISPETTKARPLVSFGGAPRRGCIDSLRWHDPDQVPRVCGPLPALSALLRSPVVSWVVS